MSLIATLYMLDDQIFIYNIQLLRTENQLRYLKLKTKFCQSNAPTGKAFSLKSQNKTSYPFKLKKTPLKNSEYHFR